MQLKIYAGLRPILGAAGILAGLFVAPASAAGPELAMLDGLRKGSWEMRIRGEAPRRMCVRSGRELIQLQHKQSGCSRYVIDDKPGEVTVQYSCPGNGYGRTNIRRESPQLVQLNSQGIEGGQPFHFNAEARHVGAC